MRNDKYENNSGKNLGTSNTQDTGEVQFEKRQDSGRAPVNGQNGLTSEASQRQEQSQQASTSQGDRQDKSATSQQPQQPMTKKIGDAVEKFGDKVEHSGMKKIGDAIESLGDKIEHSGGKTEQSNDSSTKKSA